MKVETGRQVNVGNIGGVSGGTINIAGGDITQDTLGQNMKVGDITGSTGVAVGNSARSNVTQSSGTDPQAIARTFTELIRKINQLADEDQKADAQDALKKLQEEARKGEQPSEGRVRKWLDFLADLSPEIFDMVVASFTSPLSGLSTAFRKIAERAEEERYTS